MKASGIAGIESISPPPTGNVTLREARELLGVQGKLERPGYPSVQGKLERPHCHHRWH